MSATRRPCPSTRAPPPPARRAAASAPARAKVCVREGETCTVLFFFFFFSQQEEHLWFCHCRQQCLTGLILRRAQTKHVAHTGMSTISPTARKLILSPAALCLCFTESIDLFFLHYTPPHHCFMAFIEQRQRISVNIHVNKSDPAYPSC